MSENASKSFGDEERRSGKFGKACLTYIHEQCNIRQVRPSAVKGRKADFHTLDLLLRVRILLPRNGLQVVLRWAWTNEREALPSFSGLKNTRAGKRRGEPFARHMRRFDVRLFGDRMVFKGILLN